MRRRMYRPIWRLRTGRGRRLWRDANRRQILEPALRLHEALHFRRHGARVEVVRDEDQYRFLVHQLVQPGQEREAFGRVELSEDAINQLVDRGVAKMAPIGALGRPGAGPDVADQCIERVLRGSADVDRMDIGAGVDTATPNLEKRVP